MTQHLADKLARLPESSGVYIMRDRAGQILYIGKAVVLRNRIRQYFHRTVSERVATMVSQVEDIEYIITNSEVDAFSLEAALIRQHQPKYNILLKDDRHAPYIRVDLRATYPTFEVTRRVRSDGARYFGPYGYGIRVWDIISILRTAYGVRTCKHALTRPRRECLHYHIHQCAGPCSRHVSPEEYLQIVMRAIDFLRGRDDTPRTIIDQRMRAAMQREEFELAIGYRDQLAAIDRLDRVVVTDLPRDIDIDCIAICSDGGYSVACVLSTRGGKVRGIRNWALVDCTLEPADALASVATQYYGSGVDIPELILVGTQPSPALAEYLGTLTPHRPSIVLPQRGVKRRLFEMALSNARDYLTQSRSRETLRQAMTIDATSQLADILGVASCRRMECFDISHISGTDIVASMVVFVDGEPARNQYRRYRIRTVDANNDFACMHEVISRRLARLDDAEFGANPDLMVIDGGQGQLGVALEAMREAQRFVDAIALAERHEHIYLPDTPKPLALAHEHNALKLLIRLRDEAHRFALAYHTNRRQKRVRPTKKK